MVRPVLLDAEGVLEDCFAVPEGRRNLDEVKLSLLRLICESGAVQYEVPLKVANTLVLSGLKGFESLPVDSALIDRLFQSYAGMSAHEYYLLVNGAWSLIISSGKGLINLDQFLRTSTDPAGLTAKARNVLNSMSRTCADYGEDTLDQTLERYSSKYRASAYFSKSPFLKLSETHFLCVSHPYLRLQLTSKFIAKALFFARQAEPTVRGRTQLSQFMGKDRLEPFFKELCNIWAPAGGHYDEYLYEQGTEDSSCDRIVFEDLNGEPCITLIQLKLKALTEMAHYATSWEVITADFAKAFSECIYKSINFLYRLEHARSTGRLRPEHRETSERITAAGRFVFLGIVPELPPIFTISFAREALMQEVRSELDSDVRKWMEERFPDGITWHLMDLSEFEIFLSAKTGLSLGPEIIDYILQNQVDQNPIRLDGTIPQSFRSFIINKYGEADKAGARRIPKMLSGLEKVFKSITADSRQLMFQKPGDTANIVES